MARGLSTLPVAASDLPSAAVRFRRASSPDEVDTFEAAWRGLDTVVANPLAQFNWTRACLSAFGADAVPHVVGGFAGARLVALAPLVKKRRHGVARLFLAGVSELSEPMDLVWSDERALGRLIRRLARGGSPLCFERMPADSLSVKSVRRIYRGRAIVITRPQPACRSIALDESWLEPQQHMQSRPRSDFRCARRNAERLGEVVAEIRVPDLRDLAELLDLAFDVEARGGTGDARAALAAEAHRFVFYRQFAQAACVDGTLRICFLRIGDRVAAMQMAVEEGGRFWLLKVGQDARFADCSPGLLLVRDTIRYAVEAGLTSYEFLSTPRRWTQAWPTTERPQVAVHVYPLGVRGLSALASDWCARLLARGRGKSRGK